MDCQTDSHLARLPSDVLAQIAFWLTTPEYSALRGTCKLVESKTFDAWSAEFFTTKSFMVSTFSLDALVAISKNQRLSHALKHVIISDYAIPKTLLYESRQATPSQETACRKAYLDQVWLFSTGEWISRVAEAITHFPNLDTIELQSTDPPRFRDGPQAVWRAYGAGTFATDTGYERKLFNFADLSEMYQGVLVAIAQTGVTPRNFEVNVSFIDDTVVRLPSNLQAKLEPFFNNLDKFHLPAGVANLPGLISLTPNVLSLDIKLHLFEQQGVKASSEEFWAWFAASPTASFPTPPPTLQNLESLTIGSSFITPECVLSIIDKYKLRSLTLWQTALVDEPAAASMNPRPVWADLLTSLSGTSLQSLTIDKCTQNGFGEHPDHRIYSAKVQFPSADDPQRLVLPSTHYSADAMFAAAATDAVLLFIKAP